MEEGNRQSPNITVLKGSGKFVAAQTLEVNGQQLSAGFSSACQAVGFRELLGQFQNFGLCELETL